MVGRTQVFSEIEWIESLGRFEQRLMQSGVITQRGRSRSTIHKSPPAITISKLQMANHILIRHPTGQLDGKCSAQDTSGFSTALNVETQVGGQTQASGMVVKNCMK